MNLKEFINSMKTSEEREWANKIVEMALCLRQQKTLRNSFNREAYIRNFKEINWKGDVIMFEQEITNLENAIKEYFDVRLGIELEDSPQINQEYVYLEFEDRLGNDRKLRARYTNTYAGFLLLPFNEQIKFLLEQIVRDAYGF